MIKHAIHKILLLICISVFISCKGETTATSTAEKKEVLKDISTGVTTPAKVLDSIKETGCAILRKGAFKYKDTDGDDVIVKIVDDVSTEEHKGGKYILMSKLTWKSDCEYDNMLIMSTVPKVTLEPGTIMNVTIDKVEGKDIYFTATAKGKSYHSMLTKIN